jgi:hypothetical protein
VHRHETDFFSLAAGLLFTVLGIVLALSAATEWTIDGRWITPVILIGLGAGGVAASLAATNRQRREAPEIPDEADASWPTDPFA